MVVQNVLLFGPQVLTPDVEDIKPCEIHSIQRQTIDGSRLSELPGLWDIVAKNVSQLESFNVPDAKHDIHAARRHNAFDTVLKSIARYLAKTKRRRFAASRIHAGISCSWSMYWYARGHGREPFGYLTEFGYE